jgi:hypothetical protein
VRSLQSINKREVFTLDTFLHEVNELSGQSDQVLEYFFVYVTYVLNHARQRYYDKLRFYEALVYQTTNA